MFEKYNFVCASCQTSKERNLHCHGNEKHPFYKLIVSALTKRFLLRNFSLGLLLFLRLVEVIVQVLHLIVLLIPKETFVLESWKLSEIFRI